MRRQTCPVVSSTPLLKHGILKMEKSQITRTSQSTWVLGHQPPIRQPRAQVRIRTQMTKVRELSREEVESTSSLSINYLNYYDIDNRQ
jgi:hypothetical protein